MTQSTTGPDIGARIFLVGFGAVAGFCLWGLADSWGADVLGARAFVALFCFSLVFFTVSLALTGPLPIARALLAGLLIAAPVTALVTWAGFRYDDATVLLGGGLLVALAALIVLISTPFVAIWLTHRSRWRVYAPLFDMAWSITVRLLAGCLFAAVFWVVVFLSNALLELVGIDIVAVLFDVDWVRFALSGSVLGLGLAVAYELRDYVSPRLILRLLRLLLPVLVVVVLVFLMALPLRGLSQLFGDFSSAATLMGVAVAAISLISIALDRDDAAGIGTPGMKLAARALTFAVPVLAGLALWAVLLRVGQYAWTPQRVLAAALASILLIYGLVYTAAAFRRRGWREAVRRGNVTMALITAGFAALWLTPVLHADRIAAQSQVARYDAGEASADQLPLWEMQAEWGRAGARALAELESRDVPLLQARIAAARSADTRFAFERSVAGQTARASLDGLIAGIAVRPEGALTLTPEMFEALPDYRITRWRDACTPPAGEGPVCVWISAVFLPGIAARDQAIVLFELGNRVVGNHVILEDGQIQDRVRELYDLGTGTWADLPPDTLERILGGAFDVVPSGVSALDLGDVRLVPGN